jgi:ferredoxin
VRAEDDAGNDVSVELPSKFAQRIDSLAQKRGITGADAYTAEWKWSDEQERDGSAQDVVAAVIAEWRRRRIGDMPPTLTVNGSTVLADDSTKSVFDYAESLGIQVPTSCIKNGKCKECIVEVTGGMTLLSPRTPPESHLEGSFRLSCQTRVVGADGVVSCHTMRRGQMKIERHAFGLPIGAHPLKLEPAVTRDGDRILIEGREIAQSSGPIHGLAMDLGTTTIVLRLFDLETGEQIADASFENPQRFGGSDVMSRIHYDTQHTGYLLMRTLAGYLTHAIEAFPGRSAFHL